MFWPVLSVMANFLVPYEVGNGPTSLLWLLPLLAAVVIVYKAIKLPTLSLRIFIKETVILFASILVVMVLITVGLHLIFWIFTT